MYAGNIRPTNSISKGRQNSVVDRGWQQRSKTKLRGRVIEFSTYLHKHFCFLSTSNTTILVTFYKYPSYQDKESNIPRLFANIADSILQHFIFPKECDFAKHQKTIEILRDRDKLTLFRLTFILFYFY